MGKINWEALNTWTARTKAHQKHSEIRNVTQAISAAISAKSDDQGYALTVDVCDAINAISSAYKANYATAIADIRQRALADLAFYTKQHLEIREAETLVGISDWIDDNLPLDISKNKYDPYGVVGETSELRQFRRGCIDIELILVKAVKDKKSSILNLVKAVRAPLTPIGDKYYWNPGSKCHDYCGAQGGKWPGGFSAHSRVYIAKAPTFEMQAKCYLDALFSEKGCDNMTPGAIEHTYLKGAEGKRVDPTYMQFFTRFKELTEVPPVLTGLRDDFAKQLGYVDR